MRLPPAGEMERLRAEFARRHYVRILGFLDARFVAKILPAVETAVFRVDRYAKSYRGICRHWGRVLTLLLDEPSLRECVRKISGYQRPILSINAVVYRQTSGKKHRVLWHTDPPTLPGRWAECTLSVNLGGPYQGGELEMRAPGSKRLAARIANTKSGDAVLFRHTLVHRGAPVVGPRPKLMIFIWFSLKPLRRIPGLEPKARKGAA